MRPGHLVFATAAIVCALAPRAASRAVTPAAGAGIVSLNAIGGLPAHLVAGLFDAIGFVETSKRGFLLLDRRAHMVYAIDAARSALRPVLKVGLDQGKILEPGVLALGPADVFAVSDAPGGLERIQYFNLSGTWVGGFYLHSTVAPRLVVDSVVMNDAGSLQFYDQGFLINQPESDSLVTDLDLNGRILRRFGALRATGHEEDRDLHLAHNIGIPLAAADGGTYVVFRTGVPVFRKYDAAGDLQFERHLEGAELDGPIQSLPTVWPRRPADEGRLPIVPPLVRAAAVDRAGRLWISLADPFTYVYDARGEKIATVQFKGAGVLSPGGFFFTSHDTVLVTPGCYEFAVPAFDGRTTVRSAPRIK